MKTASRLWLESFVENIKTVSDKHRWIEDEENGVFISLDELREHLAQLLKEVSEQEAPKIPEVAVSFIAAPKAEDCQTTCWSLPQQEETTTISLTNDAVPDEDLPELIPGGEVPEEEEDVAKEKEERAAKKAARAARREKAEKAKNAVEELKLMIQIMTLRANQAKRLLKNKETSRRKEESESESESETSTDSSSSSSGDSDW